jgi:hypothetical protein
MDPEEAIYSLEAVGHDFYVYKDKASGQLRVRPFVFVPLFDARDVVCVAVVQVTASDHLQIRRRIQQHGCQELAACEEALAEDALPACVLQRASNAAGYHVCSSACMCHAVIRPATSCRAPLAEVAWW